MSTTVSCFECRCCGPDEEPPVDGQRPGRNRCIDLESEKLHDRSSRQLTNPMMMKGPVRGKSIPLPAQLVRLKIPQAIVSPELAFWWARANRSIGYRAT